MGSPNSERIQAALPAVNLVTLVVAGALLWWRTGQREEQVAGLRAAVSSLQIEIVVLKQAPARP